MIFSVILLSPACHLPQASSWSTFPFHASLAAQNVPASGSGQSDLVSQKCPQDARPPFAVAGGIFAGAGLGVASAVAINEVVSDGFENSTKNRMFIASTALITVGIGLVFVDLWTADPAPDADYECLTATDQPPDQVTAR